MTTNTNGAEFKRFYNDSTFWPDNAWHEDVGFYVDGELIGDDFDMNTVADTAKVGIDGGIVLGLPKGEPSVESYFKRWRKEQTLKTLVVEVDLAKLDDVLAAIKAAGGKVVL